MNFERIGGIALFQRPSARNMLIALGLLCWFAFPFNAGAATTPYSLDVGQIGTFHSSSAGNVAIILTGGFPNAVATGQCTSSNGFAGFVHTTSNSSLKATLLAAKMTGSNVQVVIAGCEQGGAWWKIIEVYVP